MNNQSSFWISTYEKETHLPIKAEFIRTIVGREKQIIRQAKQRATRKGWYIIHSYS